MDTPRKLIVGYDLCEDYSQISCYSYKTFEPVPINTGENEEARMIPTVLCLKKDTKQWLYGEEALALRNSENAVFTDHFLTKIKTGEETEILQQKFSGTALLEKFLRRSLTLIKNYFPTERITKLVVTIRDADPVTAEEIYKALSMLGLEKDRASVISHAGAYLYYALSQDSSLWMNDVGLFDFGAEGFIYNQININRRSRPMIAGLTRTDFTDTLNLTMLRNKDIDPSYILKNITNTALDHQIISTIYFTGCGFSGDWANDTIKKLCVGRRIFIGQNLYTKGACYAAKELSGDTKLSNIILLNDDMITSSVLLQVYSDARFMEVAVARAGTCWYEVNNSIEVIPENMTELELIIDNIVTREITREKIPLDGLPNRPERMTRLEIHITFTDLKTGLITVNDLGFGEIFPGIGKLLDYTINIG